MPARRRRKIARRSKSGRIRWGALAFIVLLIVVVVYGLALINRQLHGYFSQPRQRQPVAIPTAESPNVSPAATPAAFVSPTPTASIKSAQLAIIIDDCGYSMT